MKVIYLLILVFLPFANSFSQRVPTGLYDVQENSPHMPIRFKINNTGQIGQCGDSLSAGITYNGVEYIRNLGLSLVSKNWFMQSNGLDLVLHSYNPFTRKSYFTPAFSGDADDFEQYAKVYFSTDFNADGTPKNFEGYNYPLWKIKPDSIKDASVFVASPLKRIKNSVSLEPDFTSPEDIVVTYTDSDVKNYQKNYWLPPVPSNVSPIGLIITQKLMSFSTGPFKNCLIIRYHIQNTTNQAIQFSPSMLSEFALGGKPQLCNGREIFDTLTIGSEKVPFELSTVWSREPNNNLGYVAVGLLSQSGLRVDGIDKDKWTTAPERLYPNLPYPSIFSFNQMFNNQDYNLIFGNHLQRQDAKNYYETSFVYEPDSTRSRLFQMNGIFDFLPRNSTMHLSFGIILGEQGISSTPTGTRSDFEPVVQKFHELYKLNKSIVSSNIVLGVENEPTAHDGIQLQLFPNPCSGELTVQREPISEMALVQIVDILGNVVLQQHVSTDAITLNLHFLPNGLYQVIVKTNSSTQLTRLQILH